MFHSRWRRMPAALLLPAAAVACAAGCGSSGAHTTSTTSSAGAVSQTGAFSSVKLRGALLTKVNGVSAAVPAESGTYASLPEVQASKQSTRGVNVSPKACARAALTGFGSGVLAAAPAAAVTFRVGGNGVSEVLVAPGTAAAANALGNPVPAICDHYTATVGGKTYRYAVTDSTVRGIGQQARVLNVKTAGYPADEIWSIVYRGARFVGAVTVVGPNASEAAVRELSQQAYAYAAKSLA